MTGQLYFEEEIELGMLLLFVTFKIVSDIKRQPFLFTWQERAVINIISQCSHVSCFIRLKGVFFKLMKVSIRTERLIVKCAF